MEFVNQDYIRKSDRNHPKKDVKVTIQYLDKDKITAELLDISESGAGVVVRDLGFNMIDNSMIDILIEVGSMSFIIPARIVFSHPFSDDTARHSKRYGIQFLEEKNKNVSLLIKNYC